MTPSGLHSCFHALAIHHPRNPPQPSGGHCRAVRQVSAPACGDIRSGGATRGRYGHCLEWWEGHGGRTQSLARAQRGTGVSACVSHTGTRIATSTVIIASTHGTDDPDRRIADAWSGKGIQIGTDTWLGAGGRVLDGTNIGDRCVIGAGAVVTKDMPDESVAVGMPARVVKRRFA